MAGNVVAKFALFEDSAYSPNLFAGFEFLAATYALE
jgi:hypothetical protein